MRKLLTHIKNFARNTNGTVAIEVVVILPILLWAIAAMAIFFDVFRTKSTAEKAAFTISDLLSRETNAITPTFVTNTRVLFDDIVGLTTPADGEVEMSDDSSMRISVIKWDEDTLAYELQWSEVRGAAFLGYEEADMTDLADSLPTMADQDTVILVETHFTYSPNLNVGLGDRDIETFVFTRPRYAPQLVFDSTS
ncbi:TadE/TadG family type IV pilus assembly protein [Cognatishimia maritima]|uniref:Flp pilus assembly protein TadG n=1 Tax=Cognatishimia maritima TaxID=870908 RepID=A0A1M5V9A5_9RHOB|nr:hypothetical protein [Cognatishimia maritima]SHH71791.1 hypothetical protein SAMN04488044_3080 [Cognatishimia maritima]